MTWTTANQDPWYVENHSATSVTSVGIARNGVIRAIAVSIGDNDDGDYIVEALNAHEEASRLMKEIRHPKDSPQDRLGGIGKPVPSLDGVITCPCTTFEQDEDCPVGFPSLLCSACDGKGIATLDKVVALAAEMMKVAEQVDELEDPFAAWESIELLKSQAPKDSPASKVVGKFQLGERVRKAKGSSWQGRVVGFYSTELTPVGYAVESEREPGSVQIYPEAALEVSDVQP